VNRQWATTLLFAYSVLPIDYLLKNKNRRSYMIGGQFGVILYQPSQGLFHMQEMASKPKNSYIEFFISGWRYRTTISFQKLLQI